MAERVKTRRPRAAHGVPASLALAAASGALWWPLSLPRLALLGALAALLGALVGFKLDRGPLKSLVPPLAALPLAALLMGIGSGLARVGWLASAIGPERASLILDGLQVVWISALGALLVAFLSERIPGARPLPSILLVAAIAMILLPHRGGAINRPLVVGDLAWDRGIHPAFLFGLAGALVAFLATLGLYRPHAARRVWMQVVALGVLVAAMLWLYPGLGVFAFSDDDPMGLAGEPGQERGLPPGGRGDAAAANGAGRDDGDLLGLRGGQGEGQASGPGAEMPFLDDYSSSSAEVPVAVVTLHDDVEPMSGVFYFRQVAFSRFNGQRLVRALSESIDEDLFPRFPGLGAFQRERAPGNIYRAELPATVSLLRDHTQPPVLTDGFLLEPATNADPTIFKRVYRSTSSVLVADLRDLLGHEAGSDAWSPETLDTYLSGPTDERYAALADEILSGLRPEYREDPWARALATALWLEENTQYSLRSKHASRHDPTASFLFGSRVGYCVHLAHASAYLLRKMGVPARVSAGYAYTASNRAEGSALLLRAGDAHAWAEVYLEGAGWIPIDPSPPSLDPLMPAPDLDLQSLLGELSREESPLLRDERWSWPLPGWRDVALGALAAFLLWALTGHLLKAWRAMAPSLARTNERRARFAYRAALDRLAEVGLSRHRGETREAFAERVSRLAPSMRALTALHLAAALGRASPEAERARSLAIQVQRELAAAGGAPRWLGLISPWRWLRSA